MAIKAAIAGMSTLQIVGTAFSAISAVSQIQAGKAQARAYQAQAKQAELQGRQQAIQYRQQGVAVLRRIRENVSATRARAAGAGLDPFAGTPASFQRFALKQGSEEYQIARENSVLAEIGGQQQAYQYQQAASQARRQGYIGAMSSLGGAAMGLSQSGFSFGGTTPRPIVTSIPFAGPVGVA